MTVISIVVPVLNEGANIARVLDTLRAQIDENCEIIVVDGGSGDDTVERAQGADRVLTTQRGRARQMNEGARVARGEIYLFLHADTALPEGALDALGSGLAKGAGWGRFDVSLSGANPAFRLIERMIGWRSRWSGIATGDQAIFVRREWFWAVGGFADIPLMEDVALSLALNKRARPVCLTERVVTSSRRWERDGIIRTVLRMWALRTAYALGVSPERLVRWYRPNEPERLKLPTGGLDSS